jgi:HSP20 family molecular chaperone IbpA
LHVVIQRIREKKAPCAGIREVPLGVTGRDAVVHREAAQVRDSKNPFADRVERGSQGSRGGVTLDVLVTPDQYIIEADLPGVMLEDIEVTIEDRELTIQAIRKHGEQSAPRKDYAFLERKFGELTRTIALPGVYGGVITKTLANGVLTIAVGRKSTHEQLS